MAKPTASPSFMDELAHAFSGVENRTKVDRYRDFQKVFMGSDEGKRVLHDILGFAKLSAPIAPPFPETIDIHRMLVLEGGRELAIQILSTLHTQHSNEERPTQTNRRLK
jgi:hypothetical protein